MENKKYGVVQAYLQDKKWKAREGESCEEATKRVTNFLIKYWKKTMKKNSISKSRSID